MTLKKVVPLQPNGETLEQKLLSGDGSELYAILCFLHPDTTFAALLK